MQMTLRELWYKGYLGKLLEYYEISNGLLLFILSIVLMGAVGYFLGSLNFGVIISKYKYGDDVRKHGSGNGGTTNMMRVYGKKPALFTLLGDLMKAIVAVMLGRLLCGVYGAYTAGLFCMIGHAYPCFFGFRGGKGVAVAAAVILCTNPFVFAILLILFAVIVGMTKYISLGSILCMLMYPVILSNVQAVMHVGDENGRSLSVVFAFLMTCLVVWLHRSNIKRLHDHTENKFSFRGGKKRSGEKENTGIEEENKK